MSSIGQRIKDTRTAKGLSQKALGALAGVSQAIISKLETGGNEKTKELVHIAQALAVSPAWLETGKGDPENGAPFVPPLIHKEVTITDNSMSPEIKAGHRIAYDEKKQPRPSDYVVVQTKDDSLIVRRLKCKYSENGEEIKLLVPNNDDYPVEILQEPLKIVGTAVEHIAPLSGAAA
jgi:transcriptional regulator with XRE-family HTH domain